MPFNTEAIIQEGRRKGLVIKRVHGGMTIRTPDGESYVPRDTTDLRHFVETYKPELDTEILPKSEEFPIEPRSINQIIDRSPRS